VTQWEVAMLMLAPLMRGRQKLRTWVAVFGASAATYFVHDPLGYFVIDAVATLIVLARPAGLPQKAIGLMFVFMMCFDFGFMFSPRYGEGLFISASVFLGWVQFLILGAWEGHDRLRRYRDWSSGLDGSQLRDQRRIR